jgi:hypothetical protein
MTWNVLFGPVGRCIYRTIVKGMFKFLAKVIFETPFLLLDHMKPCATETPAGSR